MSVLLAIGDVKRYRIRSMLRGDTSLQRLDGEVAAQVVQRSQEMIDQAIEPALAYRCAFAELGIELNSIQQVVWSWRAMQAQADPYFAKLEGNEFPDIFSFDDAAHVSASSVFTSPQYVDLGDSIDPLDWFDPPLG